MITMSKIPFKELDENRQLEIVSEYMETNDWWHEYIFEKYNDELMEHGFSDIEINFSGFWSQGDGASFTADRLDIKKFIEKELKNNLCYTFEDGSSLGDKDEGLDEMLSMALEDISEDENVSVMNKIIEYGHLYGMVRRKTWRYYHENTVESEIFGDYEFDFEDNISEDSFCITESTHQELLEFISFLDRYLATWIKDKCKEIYRALEQEWEAHHKGQLKLLKEQNDYFKP